MTKIPIVSAHKNGSDQSVALLSTLRDPMQLRRRQFATRQQHTQKANQIHFRWKLAELAVQVSTVHRDVSAGATGVTAVTLKFSNTLTLF